MQSVPDSFYVIIFIGAFLLMITERCWHLQLMLVFSNVPENKISREDRIYNALLGFAVSAILIILVFTNFTFDEVKNGIADVTEASKLIGIGMWCVLATHAITFVTMFIFMIWHIVHPPTHKPR